MKIFKNLFDSTNSTKNDITFVDRIKRYYKEKENDLSPLTLQNVRIRLNNYIEPYWCDVKIKDITISDYQKWVSFIYSKTELKKGTCNNIVMITDAVLRECYKLQEVEKNFADFKIITRKDDRKEKNIYTPDEARKILKLLNSKKRHSPLKLVVNIIALTGMRFGEVAGLLWENIDFENNVIKVRTNMVYANHRFYLKGVKTKSGIRDLKVPQSLIDMLKEEKERQEELRADGKINNEHDVVCLSVHNKYVSNGSLKCTFIRFCKKNNIEYKGFHALRHTHATALLLAGIDMKTISKRLGHRDIQITMDVYSHVLEEMDTKASEKIEELFL